MAFSDDFDSAGQGGSDPGNDEAGSGNLGVGDPGRGGDSGRGGDPGNRQGGRFTPTAAKDTLSPQERAALILKEATEKGITFIEEAINQGREDLAPFADAGAGVLPGLQDLITDPNAKKDFVTNNPFFQALADDAQRRIFGNQAARGKLASGGTAEALQNSILLLGEDLVNKNIGQRQNLANLGVQAAGGQAATSAVGARSIADLVTSGASAEAAGIIGTENTRRADSNASKDRKANFITAGVGALIKLSDIRFKENIRFVNKVNGIPYYFFKYKGENDLRFGTMAQEVQHIPGAVLDLGGKKYVDYGRLH